MRIIGVFLGLFSVLSLAGAVAAFSTASAELKAQMPVEEAFVVDQ